VFKCVSCSDVGGVARWKMTERGAHIMLAAYGLAVVPGVCISAVLATVVCDGVDSSSSTNIRLGHWIAGRAELSGSADSMEATLIEL